MIHMALKSFLFPFDTHKHTSIVHVRINVTRFFFGKTIYFCILNFCKMLSLHFLSFDFIQSVVYSVIKCDMLASIIFILISFWVGIWYFPQSFSATTQKKKTTSWILNSVFFGEFFVYTGKGFFFCVALLLLLLKDSFNIAEKWVFGFVCHGCFYFLQLMVRLKLKALTWWLPCNAFNKTQKRKSWVN